MILRAKIRVLRENGEAIYSDSFNYSNYMGDDVIISEAKKRMNIESMRDYDAWQAKLAEYELHKGNPFDKNNPKHWESCKKCGKPTKTDEDFVKGKGKTFDKE